MPRDGAIPTSSFPALSLGLEFLSCQQQKDLEKLLFSWPILLEVIPPSRQELSHFCAVVFMREVKTPAQNQTCWQFPLLSVASGTPAWNHSLNWDFMTPL